MSKTLERLSPCKVNLLLNILGKRPDGFHELETLFLPIPVHDKLIFDRAGTGIRLTCNQPELPTDGSNLVVRAAESFLATSGIKEGISIHLEKQLPVAAGLGGGSGNAATTLLALNELFGSPLRNSDLHQIAAQLGSDVPFFLQDRPALAFGRGENVRSLDPFKSLHQAWIFLYHPGFGISTAWAYKELAKFPEALNGRQGRAERLAALLNSSSLPDAGKEFYNSLEAPALYKFPILRFYQESLKNLGAAATLMSGSGSTTFALFEPTTDPVHIEHSFEQEFGNRGWLRIVQL
ncbi:MAG: 4-(cytidine 5'-diphospho)-2-C-methyl-D-erythritol kinase [Verrucomicrobiota bacterium]|nr:4-(cytidine 5'-diphospho)-2-C-methyl-D-erythritol kinase [Verrucomicrobiota bacterium]